MTQWAQTEIQGIPFKHRRTLVLQGCPNTGSSCPESCGVFILGGNQNTFGYGSEQSTSACVEQGVLEVDDCQTCLPTSAVQLFSD